MFIKDKFLERIPQYTRNRRHIDSLFRHGTARKLYNLLKLEWNRNRRCIKVLGRPYILFLDACNLCNLRCPLCPTGLNDLGRPQSMLCFEDFRRYFDPFAPYLFELYLHNWGESLLNPEVFSMVTYAQKRNVGTNLSSNFVHIDAAGIDRILESGLEYLVISLDGTSPATYAKYRIRGDFERVVENMKALLNRRRERRAKWPIVEWQFIVMKHNQHEIPTAKKMAKSIGVDLLRFIPVGMPFDMKNRAEVAAKWFPDTMDGGRRVPDPQIFGQSLRKGPCFYLYRAMVVNADGGISPCCLVYRQKHDFATLPKGMFDPLIIWNNEHFSSARSLFSPQRNGNRKTTVCNTCDLFEKHRTVLRGGIPKMPL